MQFIGTTKDLARAVPVGAGLAPALGFRAGARKGCPYVAAAVTTQAAPPVSGPDSSGPPKSLNRTRRRFLWSNVPVALGFSPAGAVCHPEEPRNGGTTKDLGSYCICSGERSLSRALRGSTKAQRIVEHSSTLQFGDDTSLLQGIEASSAASAGGPPTRPYKTLTTAIGSTRKAHRSACRS